MSGTQFTSTPSADELRGIMATMKFPDSHISLPHSEVSNVLAEHEIMRRLLQRIAEKPEQAADFLDTPTISELLRDRSPRV